MAIGDARNVAKRYISPLKKEPRGTGPGLSSEGRGGKKTAGVGVPAAWLDRRRSAGRLAVRIRSRTRPFLVILGEGWGVGLPLGSKKSLIMYPAVCPTAPPEARSCPPELAPIRNQDMRRFGALSVGLWPPPCVCFFFARMHVVWTNQGGEITAGFEKSCGENSKGTPPPLSCRVYGRVYKNHKVDGGAMRKSWGWEKMRQAVEQNRGELSSASRKAFVPNRDPGLRWATSGGGMETGRLVP